MSSIRKNIVIIGIVQGVFFRASTKKKADQLGIRGVVMNQSDGTVFIDAVGFPEQMDEFIKWCRIGPEMAQVKNLQISDKKIITYDSFEIRRNS